MVNNIEKIQIDPIKSTITLSIPIIILLFLDTAYSMGDLYWIGGLGTLAISAMGYIANIHYIINKVGVGIGSAVNVIVSNAFGEKNYEKITNIALHGLIMIAIIGIAIPLFTIPFLKTLCGIINLDLSDLIYTYLCIPLIFIVFSMMESYLTAILGSEGNTKTSTAFILIGNLINVILDPIFIFNLKMGMWGAGLATAIGFIISTLLFIYLFFVKKTPVIKLDFTQFEYDFSIIKEIIKLAVPIILTAGIVFIVGFIVNFGLYFYASPTTIAAYVIVLQIQNIFFSPTHGIGSALETVIGHLNGAKRFLTIKNTIRKILFINLVICAFFTLVLIITQSDISTILTSDLKIVAETQNLMLFNIISLITYSIMTVCNYSFIGTKKSHYTTYFLILNILLIFAFLYLFNIVLNLGGYGVLLSVVISDIIETIIMILLLERNLNKKIRNNPNEALTAV